MCLKMICWVMLYVMQFRKKFTFDQKKANSSQTEERMAKTSLTSGDKVQWSQFAIEYRLSHKPNEKRLGI